MTDSWSTPPWLMSVFDGWFDPCPINGTGGLDCEWKDRTYCNPPYSNPLPWVQKAIEESKQGKLVVMLLHIDFTTKWCRELLAADAHFFYSGERLKFTTLEPGYAANRNPQKPSMLVILGESNAG